MAIKSYRPTSPAIRFRTTLVHDELSKDRPLKRLTRPKRRISGRDNKGHLQVRYRGGGHKKLYRVIDFRRDKRDIPARVVALEYDPNRSARIALLSYADGERRYILSPNGLSVGKTLLAGEGADILVGNALPLKNIPLGTMSMNSRPRYFLRIRGTPATTTLTSSSTARRRALRHSSRSMAAIHSTTW